MGGWQPQSLGPLPSEELGPAQAGSLRPGPGLISHSPTLTRVWGCGFKIVCEAGKAGGRG